MTDWDEPGIRYEVAEGIATITLDRPKQRNAVTPAMNEALFAAFRRAEADDEVRVVLLTGAGDTFCAGADVKWFIEERLEELLALPVEERVERGVAAMAAADPTHREDYDDPADLRLLLGMRTPVVVAINGPALGYGTTMTLPCDVRIAGDTATFGMLFIRRGMVPDFGSLYLLPRLIGAGHAHELCLTGRVIDAHEAARIGLANRVVSSVDLLPEARAVAASIAEQAPLPLGLTRQGLHRSWETSLDSVLEFQRLTMEICRLGPDYTARLESFRSRGPRTTDQERPR